MAAMSHVTKVFAVKDCAISPLTADPAGGSATYGTKIDVPGIKTMEISGDMATKELRGDNGLLDSISVLQNVKVKITNAKLSLDVLAALFGGAVVDVSTGTITAEWDLTNTSAPAPFKLEGASPSNGADVVGGDVHFILHKCTASAFPDLGFAEEDYRPTGFEAAAVPLLSTGKWVTAHLNAIAVPIA